MTRRRSHAPIFWLLFGAGGMLAALFGTGLVAVTGLAAPLGIGHALDHATVLALAKHPLGKAALFGVVMLFAWHAAHRLLHSLHDVGIRIGPASKALCYGSAAAVTVVVAWALLALGF
jgi:fumarate reductase subunit D